LDRFILSAAGSCGNHVAQRKCGERTWVAFWYYDYE